MRSAGRPGVSHYEDDSDDRCDFLALEVRHFATSKLPFVDHWIDTSTQSLDWLHDLLFDGSDENTREAREGVDLLS